MSYHPQAKQSKQMAA